MSSKIRNYVMDDDVLNLILCELPIKQLLRLESVSEQFRDCVNYALKRKTGIRLGKKFQNLRCCDKNHSIVGGNIRRSVKCSYNRYDITYELDTRLGLNSFGLILKKCSNIKALYLSECRINEKVILLLIENCKQLKCLCLAAIFCHGHFEEWAKLTVAMANLNLTHLAIVGQCYQYEVRQNCSQIQQISPQINYLVKELPALESFMAYWYDDDLDNLVSSLPPTLKSLQLIRCSSVSTATMSLLNSGNFPCLKDLKIDLNFYGRTQELPIFKLICYNLNLDNLVFYCDNELENMDDLYLTNIKKLKIKVYERSYSGYVMSDQFLSLKSLCLVNHAFSPDNIYLHRAFPQLRDLTIRNYHFICVCSDEYSDGESRQIYGERYSECFECNPYCIEVLSRIMNLKRLRIFYLGAYEAHAIKHFLHLPILELPGASGDTVAKLVANACIKICDSRRLNPFAMPLTVRSERPFIEILENAINKLRPGQFPTNLSLHIRQYREKRYLDY